MKLGYCKFHKRIEPLVKAHVIPAALHYDDEQRARPYRCFSDNPEFMPKKHSARGLYDPNLNCLEFERTTKPWEEHMLTVTRYRPRRDDWFREGGFIARGEDGERAAYRVPIAEYAQLKLFFMSLLWRAGASDREEFAQFAIPDHLPLLEDHINARDPGSPDRYGVVLMKFVDEVPRSKTTLLPRRREILGVTFAELCFNGFSALVKLSDEPLPEGFNAMRIGPGSCWMVCAPFVGTHWDEGLSRSYSVAQSIRPNF